MTLLADISRYVGVWEDQLGDISKIVDAAELSKDPNEFIRARKAMYDMRQAMTELRALIKAEEIAPDVEEIFDEVEYEDD